MAAPKEVTFHKDVLPILQKRCQECHRAGEAAPMSLLTYAEARPWAKAMKMAVVQKKMPPWFADSAHGKWANDRSMTQAEIDTLSAWADSGAKEGSPKDAPPALTFAQGWTIGKPDLVLDMGVDYKVPAQGTVEYTYFVAPTGFTEDKWIEKIEVRPGARSVVHHIVLMARAPGSKSFKDAKPGIPFVPAHSDIRDGSGKPDNGNGVFARLDGGDEMVSIYVPGGLAYTTKPGQARLIKAGSDLVFQMHYTADGKEAVDRSVVGIVFAKEPPKERVVNTFIANLNLHIPPQEPEHRVDARVIVHRDVVLQSLFPHMHLRGKAFEYVAKYPSGETQTLLRVPRYDFNWQLTYELEKPLLLPKGTELTATAWYDNSPNNKYNPDPSKDVYWGDQSWEEMLAGFADFVIPVDVNPGTISKPEKKPAVATGGAAE
ncbi:MAG: thiol-disulfide isomerase [Acidobacteriota bacterium]